MENKLYIDCPKFTGRNVPITEIAKAIGKDAQYVRVGLQQGILKFGYAMKLDKSSEYNYYWFATGHPEIRLCYEA